MTNQHFLIERNGTVPLEFDGQLLADVSSAEPDSPRWQEIRIYRSDQGRFITEVLGCTRVRGERTIRNVEVFSRPEDVQRGVRRRKDGREFVTELGHEALRIAAEHEPLIYSGTEQV